MTDAAAHAAARQRVEELVAKDMMRERKEALFRAPSVLSAAVLGIDVDQKVDLKTATRARADTHMVDAIFSLSVISLVSMGLMFAFASQWWHGLLYTVSKAVLLERFMLTLHFSAHRRIFTGAFGSVHYLMPFVIAPLFGMPSGAYELHHIVMHHRGNNIAGDDISTTMIFQRDNILHWVMYWLRYALLAPFELMSLGLRKQYNGALMRMVVGISIQALVTYRLYALNPYAAFWTLIIPHAWSSAGIMLGNFSQHIFVDPDDPGNSYQITYNCLNAPMNSLTFNDGYHVAHHLQSGRHWSDLPEHMTKYYDRYVENKAFAFEGLGFIDVGFLVFTGQLEKLADKTVLPVMPRDELIALMKKRLQKITPVPGKKYKIT